EGQKDCRKWKAKDLKGFMAKFADLEKAALRDRAQGEAGRLSPVKGGEQPGGEGQRRGEGRIGKSLGEVGAGGVPAEVGTRVAEAWGDLSAEARQTILDLVDAATECAQPASGQAL